MRTEQKVGLFVVLSLLLATNVSAEIPPTPASLAETHNTAYPFSVNWTWSAGSGNVTQGYNATITNASGTSWLNGTNTYLQLTGLGSYTTHTIKVWAWNATGGGNISLSYVTDAYTTPCQAGRVCVGQISADINAALTAFWLVPQSIVDNFGILITLVLLGAIMMLVGVILHFLKKLMIQSISKRTGVKY